MSFDYILLDLDGTLTNPFEGIAKSINYAMEKMGKPCVPESEIPKFIGPPLKEGYMLNLGFSSEEAEKAVFTYRERYTDIGLFENELMPGAKELLKLLSEHGKTIALATLKPEDLSIKLLKHFGIYDYFDFISAAQLNFDVRNNKTDIIKYALENLKIDSLNKLSKTVMVGDRFHDIEGAKNTGIRSIGVLSGFGNRKEFTDYGADFIAENLTEAGRIIISNNINE